MVFPLPGIDVPVDADPQARLMTETWYNYFRTQQQLTQQLTQQIETLEGQIEDLLAVPKREFLTADTTFWVRDDGDDAHDGGADSASSAKKTWQGAVDYVLGYFDFRNFNVRIKHGSEGPTVFPAGMLIGNQTWVGGGILTIDGVASASCEIDVASGAAIYTQGTIPGNLNVENIKLSAPANDCVRHTATGTLNLMSGIDWGDAAVAHVECHHTGCVVNILSATQAIHGSAALSHIWAHSGGAIYHEASAISIYDEPTFAAFAQANTNGVIQSIGSTFVGVVHGPRYYASSGGQIITASPGGATYFPGDAAGGVDATSYGYYS